MNANGIVILMLLLAVIAAIFAIAWLMDVRK